MDAWSTIISGVTLLAAIFSPVITAIINNRYAAKKQRAEFYDMHRAKAIENYIHAAGKAVKHSDINAVHEFGEVTSEIYFYTPESLWPMLDKLDELISSGAIDPAREQLRQICKSLALNPPRLNKKKTKHKYQSDPNNIK